MFMSNILSHFTFDEAHVVIAEKYFISYSL